MQPMMPQPEMRPDPMALRMQLVNDAEANTQQPDAAAEIYQQLGFNVPGVALKGGYQVSVSHLSPGDIVGWKGGHEPDGRYIGNLAVYAGNGEIIESFYGNNRRRKLDPHENTFGMQVALPDEDETNPTGI